MSEEKMEHSPLPWQARQVIAWDSGEITNIVDNEGVYVAGEVYDNNADFITTACNSYYDNKAAIAELVGAVVLLTELVEDGIDDSIIETEWDKDAKEAIALSNTIIAKHKADKP